MLSQKIWFNANTVLQDFIIVLTAIVEYAENKKKNKECLYKSLHDTQHRSEPLSWNSLRIRID